MNLELFHRWYDPSSEIVLDFLKANNISHLVTMVDIDDDDEFAEDRLKQICGRVDVPCLVHDMTAIFGAEDIIEWLNVNVLRQGGSQFI